MSPSTAVLVRSTGELGPSTGELEPSTGELEPSTGELGPSTGELEPSTGELEPSTGELGPSTGELGPSTGELEPSTGELGPSTGELEPSTGELGPSTGELEPSTGELGPSTGRMSPSTAVLVRGTGGLEARRSAASRRSSCIQNLARVENFVPAERIPQPTLAGEVDVPAKQLHQLIPHLDEIEEAALCSWLEGDQDIHVALRRKVLAEDRAEQGQLADTPSTAEGVDRVLGEGDASPGESWSFHVST